MATPHQAANGHRRRELVKRVMAEETHCALCGGWVDKTLTMQPGRHGPRCKGNCPGCIPHDDRAEVDEDIPRSRGGSPTARDNCHLMHRGCNRAKGAMTIAEYKTQAQTQASKPRSIANLIEW